MKKKEDVKEQEQDSIVAAAPRPSTANDATMMMTFVKNFPQAISTPKVSTTEGMPSLNSVTEEINITKDVFNALKTPGNNSSALHGGRCLNLTNDVFKNIGETSKIGDATMFNVEPRKSMSNLSRWSEMSPEYSPIVKEKMKHLVDLMEMSRKEKSAYPDDGINTVTSTRNQQMKGFLEDSITTPIRSTSRHRLADSMVNQTAGHISFDALGMTANTEANRSAVRAVMSNSTARPRSSVPLFASMREEQNSTKEDEWQTKMRLIEEEVDTCLKVSKTKRQTYALLSELAKKWTTSIRDEEKFDKETRSELLSLKSEFK